MPGTGSKESKLNQFGFVVRKEMAKLLWAHDQDMYSSQLLTDNLPLSSDCSFSWICFLYSYDAVWRVELLGFSEGVWLAYSVLFMTVSFSVFYEMHGTFFNLIFSSLFHKINVIMNDFARMSVAFFN